MSFILKFSSLKISLETLESFVSREEKIETSREASWDIRNSPPFPIYSWIFVILRGYFKDATLLVS